MRENYIPKIVIDDPEVIYPNFRGLERGINKAGDRNFCVIIPDEWDWERMQSDGWNVKEYFTRDGDKNKVPTGRHFIPIKINYNYDNPPILHYINGENEIILDEELIDAVDDNENSIGKQIDGKGVVFGKMIINPGFNRFNDAITGYVHEMWITANPTWYDYDSGQAYYGRNE